MRVLRSFAIFTKFHSALKIWQKFFAQKSFICLQKKFRSSRSEVLCKKGVLKSFAKFTGRRLCQSLFFNKVVKKETLTQVFSCEFCEVSKNTFFIELLRWLLLKIKVLQKKILRFCPRESFYFQKCVQFSAKLP